MQPLVTTYLQMLSPLESRKPDCGLRKEQLQVREIEPPDWKFNRDMYFKVGGKWKWVDKRPWTDEQWTDYARDSNLRTFALYFDDELAGYYELRRNRTSLQAKTVRAGLALAATEQEVEIAYFGLLPEIIGCGLGGALLISAIENAWSWSPTPSRVWLHTCNRDHPHALANYQARGFKIYKVEEEPSHY
jgi:GNAT superfamily N-acetyltransferase